MSSCNPFVVEALAGIIQVVGGRRDAVARIACQQNSAPPTVLMQNPSKLANIGSPSDSLTCASGS